MDEPPTVGDTHRYFLPPKTRRKVRGPSSLRRNRKQEYDPESEFLLDVEANSRLEKAAERSEVHHHEHDGGINGDHHARSKLKSTEIRYPVPYISAIRNSSIMSQDKRKLTGGQQSLPRKRVATTSRRTSRRRSDDANPVTHTVADEDSPARRRDDKSHGEAADVSTGNQNSRLARTRSRIPTHSTNRKVYDYEAEDIHESQPGHGESDESDPLTPNQSSDNQVNQVYRPNYQHYESRGSFPQSNYRSSNDRALIKIEPNGNIVFPNTRNRYQYQSRPQSLSEYRSQNVLNSGGRGPTILVPNQDIRQLSRNFFATPSPTNPAPVAYDRSSGRGDARRSQLYRTVVADHLIDEDDHQPRSVATTTPSPTTEAPVSIQTIPFDYHYHYERDKRPTYDYQDQPGMIRERVFIDVNRIYLIIQHEFGQSKTPKAYSFHFH